MGLSKHSQRPGAARIRISAWIADLFYIWTAFIIVIAVPFSIVDVILTEEWLHGLPQSESAIHVGAWSPWVSTALVLSAAVVTHYYEPFTKMTHHHCFKSPFHYETIRHAHNAGREVFYHFLEILKNVPEFFFGFSFFKRIQIECKEMKQFSSDPEESLSHFRQAKQESHVKIKSARDEQDKQMKTTDDWVSHCMNIILYDFIFTI